MEPTKSDSTTPQYICNRALKGLCLKSGSTCFHALPHKTDGCGYAGPTWCNDAESRIECVPVTAEVVATLADNHRRHVAMWLRLRYEIAELPKNATVCPAVILRYMHFVSEVVDAEVK